jgi:two-component system response regulator AgrA
MKIAICEDERAYLDYLTRMLKKISDENRLGVSVALACTKQEELECFLLTDAADVYLLDINLKSGLEGYELALRIRERQPRAYIVFISENLSMVFQSFKAHPFDFLPKPVSENVLANLLDDISRHMAGLQQEGEQGRNGEGRYIIIRSAAKNYRVNKDDIIMIEKLKEKAFVYTSRSKLTCNISLDDFEEMLADSRTFARCHKSFIVNKNYIVEEDPAQMKVILENGLSCYVSRNYRKRVFG